MKKVIIDKSLLPVKFFNEREESVKVSVASKPGFAPAPLKPVYPKVKMPEDRKGYIKPKKHDFL